MKQRVFLVFLIQLLSLICLAQVIQKPTTYLGYELGSKFTYHADLEAYCEYIASAAPDHFKKLEYGISPEGRSLFVLIYSSQDNLQQLEKIRINHLKNNGLAEGPKQKEENLLTWLSFNIHGDEASSTEAAMKLLYHLSQIDAYENQIIIIDPCLNPDGREKYVNWFTGIHKESGLFDKNDAQHNEIWPGGRYNHFLSDLNRDWLWQVQPESQQRLALYNAWMPHVHADFHEMEVEKSYFFPPPAEPLHEVIEPWQKQSLDSIGKNLSILFNEKNWDYFNAKEFDLLYPSYGDTYATYNGALGMTFEQGGSAEAGLLYIKENGDTLRLSDRIEKHFETAKNLLSTVSNHRHQIIEQFQKYHQETILSGNGKYKAFLVKNENSAKTKILINQLNRLDINFQYADQVLKSSAYSFSRKSLQDFDIEKNDIYVSTRQAKGHLVRVLFEPNTHMDSLVTYDISSWALPYLHHLEAYAFEEEPLITLKSNLPVKEPIKEEFHNAFSIDWNAPSSAKWLSLALQQNTPVYADSSANPKIYILLDGLDNSLIRLAQTLELNYSFLKIPQWNSLNEIKNKRIALLIGQGTEETELGDLMFYLEKYLAYPYVKIYLHDFQNINLKNFDLLIFPEGNYRNFEINKDKMRRWIADGGKLVSMENDTDLIKKIGLGSMSNRKLPKSFYFQEKDDPKNLIQGAIYQIDLPSSSSMAKGLNGKMNILLDHIPKYKVKNAKSKTVIHLNKDNYLSGFVGNNAGLHLSDSFIFGMNNFGSGQIYQLHVNPLFRGIMEDGKLFMANILFMP